MSIHGPLWLHIEPPQFLNFDFDAFPDPASEMMRIRIRDIGYNWAESYIFNEKEYMYLRKADLQSERYGTRVHNKYEHEQISSSFIYN